MDLALNDLQRLICHKTQQTKPNQIPTYLGPMLALVYPMISSSSSCRAASTDIPDPLSPLLPIVHRLRQVFRATSRILT